MTENKNTYAFTDEDGDEIEVRRSSCGRVLINLEDGKDGETVTVILPKDEIIHLMQGLTSAAGKNYELAEVDKLPPVEFAGGEIRCGRFTLSAAADFQLTRERALAHLWMVREAERKVATDDAKRRVFTDRYTRDFGGIFSDNIEEGSPVWKMLEHIEALEAQVEA